MQNDHAAAKWGYKFFQPIPFDFFYEGVRYLGSATPMAPPYFEGVPAWFDIDLSEPKLDKSYELRAISYHPVDGWHSINQFADRKLVAEIMEVIAVWYG